MDYVWYVICGNYIYGMIYGKTSGKKGNRHITYEHNIKNIYIYIVIYYLPLICTGKIVYSLVICFTAIENCHRY